MIQLLSQGRLAFNRPDLNDDNYFLVILDQRRNIYFSSLNSNVIV